eukprot:CAMPEP_0176371508 /NCGR_PEP_ID=MMETSP0126-20121128/24747_1 /TAXON_ID=141414 ORGANISM="Strombidinopsis acuminatum, Strain SPMC142" /NCGR_SAMPLE_ID=MMETSP0126 /ASSEMBLY_ACC=CAM_ASM_000229 /LENGTH=133 /DNA_ID=CAMNT_0017730993 /DNA_START=263 /DNA_END=665 /DNA_ORIENTATION=+
MLGLFLYLTLRECTVAVYVLLLVGGTIQAFFNVFSPDIGTIQQVGILINIVFYVFAIYFVGKAYYEFRKSGGIHGTGPRENLLEDRVYNGAVNGGNTGANYLGNKVNQALDKDDAKLANEEELRNQQQTQGQP